MTVNNKDYRFWVVAGGQIQSGWEYREDAQDDQAERKEFGVKARLYTRQGLANLKLDPDVDANWSTGRQIEA